MATGVKVEDNRWKGWLRQFHSLRQQSAAPSLLWIIAAPLAQVCPPLLHRLACVWNAYSAVMVCERSIHILQFAADTSICHGISGSEIHVMPSMAGL